MMKEIIITSKFMKREGFFLLLSFILAFIVNVVAIIVYKRPWIELISQIGYVIFVCIIIYFLTIILRILLFLIMRIIRVFKKVN
jgi:hypothetical protein